MKPDEKVLDQRRAFLNAMGCAAAGFVPAADAHAQAVTPAPRSRGRDRALWITWYDLPEDGRETYLSWLHQMHIPALLKRPGFLWGAHYASVERGSMSTMRRDSSKKDPRLDPTVPTGDRYLLLFGAEHANVFGNPVPSGLHASLGPDNRKMLALRTGERMNIMVEAATVEGPEAKSYGAGMMVASGRRGNACLVRPVPHAADDHFARMRENPETCLGRGLGEARDPVRVHVARDPQPLLHDLGGGTTRDESLGRPHRSQADTRARLGESRDADLADGGMKEEGGKTRPRTPSISKTRQR
jgi:hypothetical protein